jgi:hypothetical protein
MTATRDKEILGGDFLKVASDIGVLIPFGAFVKKAFSGVNDPNLRERYEQRVIAMGKSSHPFILSLGKDGTPCYFVEPICQDVVIELLRLADGRKKTPPKDLAISFYRRVVPTPKLEGMLGLTREEIIATAEYALQKKLGLKIQMGRSGGYPLGPFIEAYQARRASLSAQ